MCNLCSAPRWKTDLHSVFWFCIGFVFSGGVKANERSRSSQFHKSGGWGLGTGLPCQGLPDVWPGPSLFDKSDSWLSARSIWAGELKKAKMISTGGDNGWDLRSRRWLIKWLNEQFRNGIERAREKLLLLICCSHVQSCLTVCTSGVGPEGIHNQPLTQHKSFISLSLSSPTGCLIKPVCLNPTPPPTASPS